MLSKTEQQDWDKLIGDIYECKKTGGYCDPDLDLILTINTHILKLERELQALKHKKAVAAILQKKQ